MAEVERLYLENLDEYVNDEARTVTYKWLSRTLSVNVDQAKRMLFEFVSEQRAKKPSQILDVIYLVSGYIPNPATSGTTYVVSLVSEDRLDSVKNGFRPVTGVHVYSVQKTRPIDSDALYSVDYDLQKQCLHDINKWSCITCKEAEPLADGGHSRRRQMATVNGDMAVNGIANHAERQKIQGFKGREASMGKTGKPCKIFEQMTARANSKKTDTQSERPSQSKGKELEKTEESTKHKAAKSFFGKQSSRKKAETKASQPTDTPSQTQNTKKRPKREPGIKSTNQPDSPSVIPDTPEADLRQQQTSPPLKGGRKAKKSKEGRLRRRTQPLASDSDSASETPEPKRISAAMDSPEESVVVEGSPVGEPESPPLKRLEKPKRKRIKQLVSNTYVNEDGEFVTEKTYESHSTDASDVEVTQIETAPVQEKAVSSDSVIPNRSPEKRPARGKQTSNKQSNLMSFFQRPK